MINGLYNRALREIEPQLADDPQVIVVKARAADNPNEVRETMDRVRNHFGTTLNTKIIGRNANSGSPHQQENRFLERIREEMEDSYDAFLGLRSGDRLSRISGGGPLIEAYIADIASDEGVFVEFTHPVIDIPPPQPGAGIVPQLQHWAAHRTGIVADNFFPKIFANPPGISPIYTPIQANEDEPPKMANRSLQRNDLIIVSHWRDLWKDRKLTDASLHFVNQPFPAPMGNGDYSDGAALPIANVYSAERFDFRFSKVPEVPQTILWQSPNFLKNRTAVEGPYTMIHRVRK